MSLKGIVSSLPKHGWSSLFLTIDKGEVGVSSKEVIDSGVIKACVGYVKKHKELENATKAMASLASHSVAVCDSIIQMKYLDVLLDDKRKKWTDQCKINIAHSLRFLALNSGADTFRAFSLITYFLTDGPVGAREYSGAAMQALAYLGTLKSEIVNNSAGLKAICDSAETGATVAIQRTCMAALNNLSVSSSSSGLDKTMYARGVLSTIAYVMNNNNDDEVLKDCFCYTRNITLTSDDIKVYLCEKGSKAINSALQHSFGPVREHAGGLIRNLGTNGAQSNYRKTCMIDAGVMPTLVKLIETDTHPGAKLQAAYGLWNLSNSSLGSSTILKGGLVPRIISAYEKVQWSEILCGEVYKNKLVGVLCCLCANAGEDGCTELRGYGLQNHLHPLMMSKDPKQQPINAACGLANLVGHLENHPLLKADTTIFEMMCDCIEATRRGEAYHGAYYSEWGLIRNLANMSVSDSNKPLLKKTNSVECACKGFRVGEKYIKLEECVAKLISNMSFSYNLQTEFNIDIMSVIKDIKDRSTSEEARRLADVALFQQKQRGQSKDVLEKKIEAAPSSDMHVMISYPWKWQKEMLALKQYLETSGLNVWFDLDDMSGSTLDAMATAVEGSFAVIICMCSEYKESAACRAEGEYAFNLRKPIIPVKPDMAYTPDGWLGMLLGSKLYFDVSCEPSFEKNCPAIVKEISKHAEGKGGKQPGGHISTTKDKPKTSTPPSPAKVSFPSKPANTSSGTGVDSGTLKTILDSFLKNLEDVRASVEKRIDERFDELDKRVRNLEAKM
eukprot:m.88490 g.88490  ORF g.88490 m.88490 type:complete len:786 (+) comp12268_c1_seq1:62-2419(+)